MAFQAGTTIRPELANADFSGFARAAEIQANALANLGRQVGEGIEKYQTNKEVTLAGLASLEGQAAADPTLVSALQNASGAVGKAYAKIESGDYNQRDVLTATGFATAYNQQQQNMQASQIRGLQLQAAESEQEQKEISRSAFDMALSASRDAGTGEIDPAALSAAYFDQGGRDPNALKIIESMQKMKGPNLEAIEVGGFTVLTEDGEYKQSFRDGEEATPSAQRVLEFKLEERKRARELYEQGNIQEANDILAVNGYKDMFGRPQTAEEVFGPLKPDPNNESSDLDDAVLGNQSTPGVDSSPVPTAEQVEDFRNKFLPKLPQ